MLNARVFTLRVLPNQDGVNILVGSLVTLDGKTRTDVGKEVEGPTESQVQGNVALADCNSRQRMFYPKIADILTGGSERTWMYATRQGP